MVVIAAYICWVSGGEWNLLDLYNLVPLYSGLHSIASGSLGYGILSVDDIVRDGYVAYLVG